jgi:arylsulfatase A-like enzyme
MKNLILLTIDALRRDMVGLYNPDSVLTPFIDSLDNRSVLFTNTLSTGPYTQASFPGILTSSYYLEYGQQRHLPSGKVMISELLKENGITTAAFHSNPYLSDFFGYNRGWDIFYDSMDDDVSNMYPFIRGDALNRKVGSWLSGRAKNSSSPFFLWIHYMDVHEPYIPARQYLEKIESSIEMKEEEMFGLFKEVLLNRDVSEGDKVGLLKQLYRAKILEVDGYVQALFQILGAQDLLDQCLVFIGSDHGDEFGEHGGLSHDGKMYRELIEVPLLLFDPAMSGGEVCELLTSNIDIAPTIAKLFGIKSPPEFRGTSLLPVGAYERKGCYGEAMGKSGHKEEKTDRPVYFYQEERMKVIYSEEDGSWSLYDTGDDPQERRNIFDSSSRAQGLKDGLIMFKEKRYDR